MLPIDSYTHRKILRWWQCCDDWHFTAPVCADCGVAKNTAGSDQVLRVECPAVKVMGKMVFLLECLVAPSRMEEDPPAEQFTHHAYQCVDLRFCL